MTTRDSSTNRASPIWRPLIIGLAIAAFFIIIYFAGAARGRRRENQFTTKWGAAAKSLVTARWKVIIPPFKPKGLSFHLVCTVREDLSGTANPEGHVFIMTEKEAVAGLPPKGALLSLEELASPDTELGRLVHVSKWVVPSLAIAHRHTNPSL